MFFSRGECTDTLRRRITELEAECKKLTMDIKVKEDQIRELELKVQVRSSGLVLMTVGVINKSFFFFYERVAFIYSFCLSLLFLTGAS